MSLNDFVIKWDGKKCDLLSFKPGSSSVKLSVSLLKTILFVDRGVRRSVRNYEVFKSIICFYSVNVVNNFSRFKFSPKVFFHNIPMFNSTTICSSKKAYIPLCHGFTALPARVSFSLHVLNLALCGTINKLSLFVAFVISKLLRAVVALKQSFSRPVVALSATEKSLITGWGLKINSALFTFNYHMTNYSIQY